MGVPLKNRLCQWGNCAVETTFVTLNYNSEEKPAFCSATHAALWLLRREGRNEIAAQLEARFSGSPVHKLVVKPRSAYTVCGLGVTAYYRNSATALTNDGTHILCTEAPSKVTCEQCSGKVVRRAGQDKRRFAVGKQDKNRFAVGKQDKKRFVICNSCSNPSECISWKNCHNVRANPIGEKSE